MINIHLNGEARQVPEGLTLAALLDWLHLPGDRVAVERNLEIVPRGQWDQTMIGEGDRLEVVQLVGGGRGYFGFWIGFVLCSWFVGSSWQTFLQTRDYQLRTKNRVSVFDFRLQIQNPKPKIQNRTGPCILASAARQGRFS